MHQSETAAQAKQYGVRSVPAIVIDGKLASCCGGRGPDERVFCAPRSPRRERNDDKTRTMSLASTCICLPCMKVVFPYITVLFPQSVAVKPFDHLYLHRLRRQAKEFPAQ